MNLPPSDNDVLTERSRWFMLVSGNNPVSHRFGKEQEMLRHRNELFQYRFSARGLKDAPPSLSLTIGTESIPRIHNKMPIVGWLMQNYPTALVGFRGVFTPGSLFGFNDGLMVSRRNDEMLEVEIPIPVLQFWGAGECRLCDGTGREKQSGSEVCRMCGGEGKEIEYDPHHRLLATAANVCILLKWLRFAPPAVSSTGTEIPPFQLLHVETIVGGSLGGVYSAPLVAWFASLASTNGQLRFVEEAMRQVWLHMHPLRFYEAEVRSQIVTRVGRDGRLSAYCSGNACSIDPLGSISKGRGYEFASHNTDKRAQQLTLLTALAALTDAAVEAGVGQR